jgi:hypothetical protein
VLCNALVGHYGRGPERLQGNLDGNTLAMTCVDHQGHSRLTYVYTSANSLRSTMEMRRTARTE